MRLRQDPPNITKKEFHEIQSHRIFDRGRERMVVRFPTISVHVSNTFM